MHFDVDQRYSLIDVVGRGAYGVVCAARDDASSGGELVAIKKINNAFEHAVTECGGAGRNLSSLL